MRFVKKSPGWHRGERYVLSDRKKSSARTRTKQAQAFRAHYARALAELVWCQRHIRKLLQSRQIQKNADVRSFCGKHWQRLWDEWAAVARLCRQRARTEDRGGHIIVAAILGGVADKLTQPNPRPLQALNEARELLAWLPSDSDPSSAEESQYWAVEDVTRLPVLDPSTKRSLIGEVLSKRGRPPDTRGIAAYALEMHILGKSWSQIERKLLPHRRDASNPGASIRREVQFLRVIFRRQGIQDVSLALSSDTPRTTPRKNP
jgi:hypothetical protein